MSELGEFLGTKFANQDVENQSLAHEGGKPTPALILAVEYLELEEWLKVLKIDWSASNSLILGHSINGILGVANGMGGGQIVLGDDGNSVSSIVVQRLWEWNTISRLNEGSKSVNIDTSHNDIRLSI